MTIQRLWNHPRIPVLSTNLVKQKIIPPSLNEEISQAAIATFDAYSKLHHNTSATARQDNVSSTTTSRRRKRSDRSSQSARVDNVIEAASGLTLNDYFFEHQRVHGYTHSTPILSQSPAIQTLNEALTVQVQNYLKLLNKKAASLIPLIQNGLLSLDVWAAIQRGQGAYHKEHVHEGVTVSGVYYAHLPRGAAPLVLYKPTLLPDGTFGYDDDDTSKHNANDAIVMQPEEGQVFIFPPWLLHGVPKVENNVLEENEIKPRISFAFNLSGAYAAGDPWSVTQDMQ